MPWLRRNFLTGLFITVPLVVSLAACVWVFQVVDGLVGPFWQRWIVIHVPGLGLLTTAALVLAAGVLASNVLGKRLLQHAESLLMRVPVFSTIYAPVKQIAAAFSPDNESGFKRVVLVADPGRGWAVGFQTREFSMDRGQGPEALLAVYVPTNHLYLGDVVVVPRDAVQYPDLTVEDGVRIVLTGGMAFPDRVRGTRRIVGEDCARAE
jgi:uncharacterized membrane protein